ncbi:polyubiquitin-B-like [Alosa sapidissima]|uniref:polyubiquitin-B-like n=1 Tax=Alosa sapidissima TaxID=34773 RepID=UPI001C09AEDC|nr:polyubiquitin-B-like [Alosa sapidissima]
MARMLLQIKFLNGETYPLEVSPSDTVGELKIRIQLLSGDAPARLKLNANGTNFSNDSSTLSGIGLQSGSYIMALIQDPTPIQVFLKNEKGQTKTFDVAPGETVTDFKHKVYNKERVPVDQQRLIYNGKQLEDGRKLEDYGIQSGSTIHLTLRLRGG